MFSEVVRSGGGVVRIIWHALIGVGGGSVAQ